MKLQYTIDGVTPFHYEVIIMEGGRKQHQSRQVILGLMYSFVLAWPTIPNSYLHRFVITQDRKRNSFVYQHTFYLPEPLQGASKAVEYCEKSILRRDYATSSGQTETSNHVTLSSQSDSDSGTHVTKASQLDCIVPREKLWSLPNDVRTQELVKHFEVKNRRVSDVSQEYYLDIGSYNIWNFNSVTNGDKGYERRITHLGEILAKSSADIVGLQEVRFALGKGGDLGPCQLHHLVKAMPNHQFLYQPAMTYVEDIFGRTEEGLAIFSRFPISSHDFILLPRNTSDPDDFHQRILLHAEVEIPVFGRVHVFLTHLSLSEEARDRSVTVIWEYMQRFSGPAVLMGDLNAEPQSKAIRFLSGTAVINGMQTKGLYDAWTMLHPEPRPGNDGTYARNEARDLGLTFSTLNRHLQKRIDYIFVRNADNFKLNNMSLLDDGKRRLHAASDHLGLLATLATQMKLHENI
ncbi:uncharacterized protein [Ptychodera flava]